MRIVLVGLTCFILGIAVFFSYNRYQSLQKENAALKQEVNTQQKDTLSTVTVAPTAEEKSIVTDDVQTSDKGQIEGTLGYPSSGIPPLAVYAKNTTTDEVFMISTKQNQTEFVFPELPPGMYHVFAYTTDGGLSGGYTKAVECGLSVQCTDHTLVEVEVKAGSVTQEVEVKDWYAPEGTFPPKP